jgi:hypothetical protein
MRKQLATKPTAALRITKRPKNCVMFEALVPSRFTIHGFGTFLENVKPGEIEVTREVFSLIAEQPYRSGLQGAEIFAQPIIAWGAPKSRFIVPLNAISNHGAKWLREACIIKD